MAATKKKTTICGAAVVAPCYDPTRKYLAFSPNNHLVHILDLSAGDDCTQWTIIQTLTGHSQTVSAIDWSPATNCILTCSHDRTAFAWSQKPDANSSPKDPWAPTLVLLDAMMKHGFTACKWSTHGKKLYVGCASGSMSIGRYDDESDWWRCVAFKPHEGAITCLAPSPVTNTLLASGSTDRTIKITSTFSKNVDDASEKVAKAGAPVAEFAVSGWVNDATWNATGTLLAVACHDSTVHLFGGESAAEFSAWQCVINPLRLLPLRSIVFMDEGTLVGAGHDYYPVKLTPGDGDDGTWVVSATGATSSKKADAKLSETQLARMKFQNQATLGTTEAVTLPTTRHHNTITSVTRLSATRFATASLDGRVELWDTSKLEKADTK